MSSQPLASVTTRPPGSGRAATAPTTSSRRHRSRSAWCCARGRPGAPVLLPRRAAEHDQAVVAAAPRSTSSTTAVSELDGSSGTATYGPPYNHNSDGQHMAFIHLQKWFGVSHPINTAQDFVLAPLRSTDRPARSRRRRPRSTRRPRPSCRPRGRTTTPTRWPRPRSDPATSSWCRRADTARFP